MTNRIRVSGFLTMLLVLAVPASRLNAQTTFGSIVGMVNDASNAVVPGATITVTNLGTNETRTDKSDASGNFSVVNLMPASYKVTVEATNFKRTVRQPVVVAVGATIRVEITLQVGAATETVEVSSQAPLLQTDSGTMSTQVTGQTVQEMPLNGRNPMNLLALSAGVVPQGSTAGGTAQNQGQSHTMVQAWGNYQIGGAIAGQNAAYIDGAPVITMDPDLASNNVAMILSQDAVQEFSVASNSVSAEFGRFAGGVINMASKGGANKLSGSVYEYFRNSFVNANEWWNKKTQIANSKPNKPLQWNQNQYGVAVGGPVVKDKLFYHFTWEGFRSTTAQPTFTNVADTNMLNGTVSYYIKDPLNCPDPTNSATCQSIAYYDASGNAITPNATGSNVARSKINSSYFDPLAQIMKGYFAQPNQSGVAVGKYNFYKALAAPNKQSQYNGRVDYALGSKQRLFARYTYWGLVDAAQSLFDDYNGWKSGKGGDANYSQQAVLGDTYSVSPTTVLDLRASWLRDNNASAIPASQGQDFSKFPGTYLAQSSAANAMSLHVLPVSVFNGSHGYNLFSPNVNNSNIWTSDYAITASMVRLVGSHTLKIGTELRLMLVDFAPGGNSGSFTFNGAATGDEWADFMFGYVQGTASSALVQYGGKDYSRYQGYYLTDTWQATHRLTLNLGLRWELPGGIFTKNDYNAVLLPDTTDTTYNVKGTLALVNSSQYSSGSTINVKHDLFAPRVGFAYRLGNDTTVRGGYGLSYQAIDSGVGVFSRSAPIKSATTYCGSSTSTPLRNQLMYNCFGPTTVNGTSYNNALIAPPLRSSLTTGKSLISQLGYYQNTNASISATIPNQRIPYTQQWNLSIGHQFKNSAMLDLGYSGSKGTFIPFNGGVQLNQIADGSYNSSGVLTSGSYSGVALTDTSVNRCGTYGGQNLSAGQCMRPYPYYGSVKTGIAYEGSMIYHAMILKGEKRFGTGGTLMGNFAWSKQIGDTDTNSSFFETATTASGFGTSGSIQDYYNLKAERAVLSYDVPYRAVVNYILTLPFGRGQRWGHDATGVVGSLISGWGISGITTFQHGFRVPFKMGGSWKLASNYGAGTIRPNITAGCSKASAYSGNARIAGWFNTKCFTTPGNYGYGNEPRVDSDIFAQGIDNFDFTALKSTKVTESTSVQFRAEFFNIFNRKQFSPPDSTVTSATFGQVLSTNGHQPRLVQFSVRVNF